MFSRTLGLPALLRENQGYGLSILLGVLPEVPSHRLLESHFCHVFWQKRVRLLDLEWIWRGGGQQRSRSPMFTVLLVLPTYRKQGTPEFALRVFPGCFSALRVAAVAPVCACIGDGPNTVSESTVSNTELSEFCLVLTEFRGENSVSSSQPIICVPKQIHRDFRRTHRVCPKTQ